MSVVTNPQIATQARFLAVERALIGWFEKHPGTVVLSEFSEWFVEIGTRRISISEMALAIAQEGG